MALRRWRLSVQGFIGAVVVGLIGVGLAVPAVRGLLQRGFATTAEYIQRFGTAVRLTADSRDVERDNQELRRTNETLIQQVATLKSGLEAAGSLSAIQQFLSSTRRQGTPAAIVAYSDDPSIRTFTISIGQRDGVAVGMAVVSANGTVVGRVISVHDSLSTVRDIRDTQSSILAVVENEKKSPGVLRGQKGITLRMTFIPKDDVVTSGEVVVTSGTEAGVPPGLVIGTIQVQETRPGDVFQTVTILNPVNVSEITAVAVIRSI